jgi:hypothetical protein
MKHTVVIFLTTIFCFTILNKTFAQENINLDAMAMDPAESQMNEAKEHLDNDTLTNEISEPVENIIDDLSAPDSSEPSEVK